MCKFENWIWFNLLMYKKVFYKKKIQDNELILKDFLKDFSFVS